jgi:hypothetical protein
MKNAIICFFIFKLVSFVQAEDLCRYKDEALSIAEDIRTLKVKKNVICKVENKDDIKAYVISAINESNSKDKLYYEEKVLKTLGIIEKTFDYSKELINIYTSQIGGYYNPNTKSFVMASWIPIELQKPVAVHELTHAIQDQYFDLKSFTDSKNLTSDELFARASLIEGDATAVMIDNELRKGRAGTLADQANTNLFLLQNTFAVGLMQNKSTPKALLNMMIFPYTAGLRFAHEIIKVKGYQGLNEAFLNSPKTTKEILHPEIYINNTYKLKLITTSDFKNIKEHEVLYQDRMGEFFISNWLNTLGVSSLEASKIASGWNSDLIVIAKVGMIKELFWKIAFVNKDKVNEFKRIITDIKDKISIKSYDCSNLACELALPLTEN